jgi:hypothetical protein
MVLRILSVLLVGAATLAAEPVDFNRDIRPVFNSKCTSCHGGVKRKGGFSLLYRSETVVKAKSGEIPIVPGKPDESAMHYRLTTTDDDERMPPKGDRLTAKEVATIKQWIAEGAPYAEHWAYLPPVKAKAPKVRNKRWARNHIDGFILRRLECERLKPSAEAPKETLLRRLHLDLTGLPPSAADYDHFMADRSKTTYETEVDRLLASKRFGERWAGMWLDLARYADTQGYEKDAARSISPYRDWVIDAFNRDPGYDQFTIDQLAGDLLPKPTQEQFAATGFHRNTMCNTEGGTSDEEFRVAAVIDRVNTTWEVWMGTSFGCVQCHSHPYDPFQHKEYYQFMDFLNSSEDSDRHDDAPRMNVLSAATRAKNDTLRAEIEALKKKMKALEPSVAAEQTKWEDRNRAEAQWQAAIPASAKASAKGVTLTVAKDGAILVAGPNPKNDTYVIAIPTELKTLAAVRIDTIPHKSFKKAGVGRAYDGNFVLSNIRLEIVSPVGDRTKLNFDKAMADFSQKNYHVDMAIHGKNRKKNGWTLSPQQAKPHWAAFGLKSPATIAAGSTVEVVLEHQFEQANFTLGSFRLSLTDNPDLTNAGSIPGPVLAAIRKPVGKRSKSEVEQAADHFRSIAPTLAPLRQQIAAKEKAMAANKGTSTLIMRELKKARETHIFNGGNWMSHGDKVTRGTPAVMPALPKTAPSNRLGMAQWMVSRDNPLTARVAVNRFWEQIFGNGIVGTLADFGTQGDKPTHPDLLDDLAVRFMDDQSWSVKALLKSFVMSATYRQSSHVTPALLERDPQNQLLARGPRYRLSAEQIRDQSLAIGGLLSAKMYGPSVMPPQPAGIWQVVYSGGRWNTPKNEDRYRRGLYTYWRRTSPYPSMESFDAPSREFCVTRRIRTNTPLQALVTLNDPAFVEAAQAMARRLMAEGGASADDKARFGFKLALSRTPSRAELKRVVSAYQSERVYYQANTGDAEALAGSKTDAVETAAWTAVANVFLNLDETLSRE